MKLRKLASKTSNVGKPIWLALGLILLGGVAALDYMTGVELSFSLFYLLPISLVAWTVNERIGLLVAAASAGLWQAVDIWSGNRYSSILPYIWNTIVRLGFFLLPVFMIRLRRAMEAEKALARTDFLTGVLNIRSFHELAQREIDRAARYQRPFTLVFIDVDNFKSVNDTLGHMAGDLVLQAIARHIHAHLRRTDAVARVGGDEFVILLPETDTQAAPVVISNLHQALLKEMQTQGWPVTFSMGALTLVTPTLSVDEMLGRADQLMYSVKNAGKNDILYATYPAGELAARPPE